MSEHMHIIGKLGNDTRRVACEHHRWDVAVPLVCELGHRPRLERTQTRGIYNHAWEREHFRCWAAMVASLCVKTLQSHANDGSYPIKIIYMYILSTSAFPLMSIPDIHECVIGFR